MAQKYTICISGAAKGETVDLDYKIAFELGKKIGQKGHTLITGATSGLPDWAAQGIKSVGGMSIGISPASSLEEHTLSYRLPTENYDFILFTGMNYVGRDALLVTSSDCIVAIGGRTGTPHEILTAFEAHKPIGIVKNSGGAADIMDDVFRAAGLGNNDSDFAKKNIFFDADIDALLDKVIKATRAKFKNN